MENVFIDPVFIVITSKDFGLHTSLPLEFNILVCQVGSNFKLYETK